jgi:hypothetical protein
MLDEVRVGRGYRDALASKPWTGVIAMSDLQLVIHDVVSLWQTGPQEQKTFSWSQFVIKRFLLCTFVYACIALSAFATCTAPKNAIEAENCQPGNPSSNWYVDGVGATDIQGFTTDISANAGQTVFFKIQTNASAYKIDIYRLGYYQGQGARLVASILPSATLPQTQPPCLTDSSTGLTDCGNWGVSASWAVPSSAVSGVYSAKLTRLDTSEASLIVFVVRNDSSHSDILVQTSDPTWEAYNVYGGSSLYTGPTIRAFKVSYNRPLTLPGTDTSFFSSEYPMIEWLEANGYDVSYFSGVDTDRNGALITQHKVFMSVGHDEYWSGGQRANVEAARAAGVNLGFFSGDEISWKTRWESSIDGANSAYRTLVCYKETLASEVIDPADPPIWTGWWRDARFSPPADGGRPGNALSGTLLGVNSPRNDSIAVSQADGRMRFWRNTSIASLAAGQSATLPAGVLGYEWDVDADNGFRPAGIFPLATTTLAVPDCILFTSNLTIDDGYTIGACTATHHLTLYKAPSSALVFGAGTVQWSWGLGATHANPGTPSDINMQQATVNLLADMGVQPATLQSGLVAATASTDTTPPQSTINPPALGTTATAGSPVTISGVATDFGGGVVGEVDVSLDGGNTWHPALGRENWSYTFVPNVSEPLSIMSRAVDDSGNLELPRPGMTLNVSPRSCPCSIWAGTAVPGNPDAGPYSPVELGVQFRADSNGYITGIRFYKSAADTGVHVGNLWSSSGALLASATFTGETGSGWQQVNFSNPVAITSNTVYLASYHTNVGDFSEDQGYFATSGVDNSPLHVLANNGGGVNGVYALGATSVFPTNGYNASNFWVDVVFSYNAVAASSLAVSTQSLPAGTQNIAYNQSLAAVGGTSPYSWSLLSGTLPSGLSLSSGGQISNTPTSFGTSRFTVQATDSGVPAQTATQALSISVVEASDPQNTSELIGDYALSFKGVTGRGGGSSVFGAVGRFTADGAGNLTNGELDTNGIGPGSVLSAQSFTGTYSIGADNRGVMTLNMGGSSATLAFAMMASGNAKFIEFDAGGGSGTIGSGTMEKVDTTAYNTAKITGDYAFGIAGLDNLNNRAAIAGRFTSSGAGAFTNAAGDLNAYGAVYSMTFTAANYAVADTTRGRGTMNLAFSFGGTPASLNFVFYIVNAGKLLVMGSDVVATATPLLNGAVLQQQGGSGGFSNASLNGGMVIYLTGASVCSDDDTSSAPDVLAGLLTANGSGGLSISYDENCGGSASSGTGLSGTYTVGSNGRVSLTVGNGAVAYLVSPNQGFAFGMDGSVNSGFVEPQAAGSLTNSAVKGTYAGLATNPASYGVTVFSGEFTADGASPSGNVTGTEDIGAPSGPSSGVAFNASYSVSSSPTNGRGNMTVASGSGGTDVIYVVSPSKFVGISLGDPNPAVLIFEQSPVLPTLSLTSLALNPASVIGGVQSSTGTVTLSGPAPAGGAQVTRSSSSGAASVPASVTVPSGATSATFTVSTSAVATSTPVTISASFAGVTLTATLTVNPTVMPPSITSQPASQTVTAGQTATFIVAASGSAPLTYQWRKNGAVIPGATSPTYTTPATKTADNGAQFTVVVSNSAGSATSNAAALTVTVPLPTVASLTLKPTSVVGGAQSSTGTVKLSGPAPAGGAQVLLSSNNSAASVPPSVTVPAGATSATFTVSTSVVLVSTSANISASYNGTSRTATLGLLL